MRNAMSSAAATSTGSSARPARAPARPGSGPPRAWPRERGGAGPADGPSPDVAACAASWLLWASWGRGPRGRPPAGRPAAGPPAAGRGARPGCARPPGRLASAGPRRGRRTSAPPARPSRERIRAGWCGYSRPAAAERLVGAAVGVAHHARQQPRDGLDEDAGGDLSAGQDVVADGHLVGREGLVHPLVDALVAPAQQQQRRLGGEVDDQGWSRRRPRGVSATVRGLAPPPCTAPRRPRRTARA